MTDETARVIDGNDPCATCDHPFGEHDFRSGPEPFGWSRCHQCDCTNLLPVEESAR